MTAVFLFQSILKYFAVQLIIVRERIDEDINQYAHMYALRTYDDCIKHFVFLFKKTEKKKRNCL